MTNGTDGLGPIVEVVGVEEAMAALARAYTDSDHTLIRHTQNYKWPHPVSEVVQSLIDAGLRLRHMGEGRSLPWLALPEMIEFWDDSRVVEHVLPSPWNERIPLTCTLIASKD